MNAKSKNLNNEFYSIYADTRCVVGEGPIWVEEENFFYWLDLTSGHIYRKEDAPNSKFERFELNVGKIGGMVQTDSNDFLLFAEHGIVWRWKPNAKPEKFAELPEARESRFNDIAASPNGDVYCGVAPNSERIASLWVLDTSKKFKCVEPVLHGMPNGMGFSPDNKTFYLTVSDERVIYKYDYCDGEISNKSVFAKLLAEHDGVPDGMAVDTEGNVWSANWNDYSLSKYSPKGEKITAFYFPIKKITSIVFGGRDMSKILLTTANYPWIEKEYEKFSSGNVLELSLSSKGLKRFKAKF